MRKKSEIYEIVVKELKRSKNLNRVFEASEMQKAFEAANKGNIQFIYKHSNKDYKDTFTMFFDRINSSPIGFKINSEIYKNYITKFGEI